MGLSPCKSGPLWHCWRGDCCDLAGLGRSRRQHESGSFLLQNGRTQRRQERQCVEMGLSAAGGGQGGQGRTIFGACRVAERRSSRIRTRAPANSPFGDPFGEKKKKKSPAPAPAEKISEDLPQIMPEEPKNPVDHAPLKERPSKELAPAKETPPIQSKRRNRFCRKSRITARSWKRAPSTSLKCALRQRTSRTSRN